MTHRHRAIDPHRQRFPHWLRTLATVARWCAPLAVRAVLYLLEHLTHS